MENYKDVPLVMQNHQFQFHIDGSVAFIDYGWSGSKLVLIHTEVPAELGGRGVAGALVERTLRYAEENGLKVLPRCSFVISFLKKHPEWMRVVESS